MSLHESADCAERSEGGFGERAGEGGQGQEGRRKFELVDAWWDCKLELRRGASKKLFYKFKNNMCK